ncbi:MAG: SDR family oxidoreductase [Actinomycetota bacterium]|nr:SDR family oxidoreductase [Actinomycetota bacterium]
MNKPVALITGASVGIGEQFARQLSERGQDVVLVARDAARLEALAKEIDGLGGGRAEVLAADLTDPQQLGAVEARARTVDLLVNNAGFGSFGPFHTLDVETEIREINLNVIALVRLTHAAASAMAERGRGGILNVSSLAGFQPGPSNATYGATKAFVTSFTEAVHEELKGTGVSVTALCPGFTHTEFQARASVPASEVPGFMWQDAPAVARAGLEGLAKNRAIVIPGGLNKVMGNLSAVTPHAITRRVGAMVLKRAAN